MFMINISNCLIDLNVKPQLLLFYYLKLLKTLSGKRVLPMRCILKRKNTFQCFCSFKNYQNLELNYYFCNLLVFI